MPSSCRRDQVDGFWFGHRRRALCFTRLYLHRITSVVISELASCHKEFQNPVMKALRYKQLDATCFCKYRDACSVTSLNRIEHRCALVRGEGGGGHRGSRTRVVLSRWRGGAEGVVGDMRARDGERICCQSSPAWTRAAGRLTKLTWLVLGPDPSVCSCRAEQFTAH